jgi:hypothetical protein
MFQKPEWMFQFKPNVPAGMVQGGWPAGAAECAGKPKDRPFKSN